MVVKARVAKGPAWDCSKAWLVGGIAAWSSLCMAVWTGIVARSCHEIYAGKPLDTAGQNTFNIYEAEIFQCLRVSCGLFWGWSPYTVQETTLCT